MGALDGIRVLDVSQGAAGPTCAMILGDHGADVVKVEPCAGEWGRGLGPPFWHGVAAAYLGMNRNKRSLAVDLKQPAGRVIVERLATASDVLVESFRPGVLDRLGLGYEALREHNPRLVYCAITAFGEAGPWKDKPGVDGVVQAMSGLMSVTGTPSGVPVKVGVPAADMTTAFLAVQGVLLALLARERSGRGQRVSISLLDGLLAFQAVPLAMYLAGGEVPRKVGSAAPYAAPNQAFRTLDGAVMVAAYTPDRWRALCRVLGRPDLEEDPRFRTNADRVHHRAALVAELEEVFRLRATAEWLEILEAADILCGPLLSYPELVDAPHVRQADSLVELRHPTLGSATTVGIPLKLEATPGAIRRHAPMVGEQSAEVLSELGYAVEEIEALVDEGVVVAPDLPALRAAPLSRARPDPPARPRSYERRTAPVGGRSGTARGPASQPRTEVPDAG